MTVILNYPCKVCRTMFVARNFIPKEIVCMNCGTVLDGLEILKEIQDMNMQEVNRTKISYEKLQKFYGETYGSKHEY